MSKLRLNTIHTLHSRLANAVEITAILGKPATLEHYCFRHGIAHMLACGGRRRAEALLTSFDYCIARLASENSNGVRPMVRDYTAVLATDELTDAAVLRHWEAFFRERAHIIARGDEQWPAHKILLQLAAEHANDSPVTNAAETWQLSGKCEWLWLRRNRRLPRASVNPCLAVFEGHSGGIDDAQELADGRVLSWSGMVTDQSLLLWDRTGKCLAVFKEFAQQVRGTLVLPEGKSISWTKDKAENLHLSDSKSGQCLVFVGSPSRAKGGNSGYIGLPEARFSRELVSQVTINCMTWLRIANRITGQIYPDLDWGSGCGRGILGLSDDRLLYWRGARPRIWDSRTQSWGPALDGHFSQVVGALELPDGRILSWADDNDKALRIWDSRSGKCHAVLNGHASSIEGARVLQDGTILSWSADHTLRLWTGSASGEGGDVLEGHSQEVTGVHLLPSGKALSWGCDNDLRIWDSNSGQCLSTFGWTDDMLGFDESTVRGLTVRMLADGSIFAYSCSGDGPVRLWDSCGESLAVLATPHSYGEHMDVRCLPDGRLLLLKFASTPVVWDLNTGTTTPISEMESERLLPELRDGLACGDNLDKRDLSQVLLEHTGKLSSIRFMPSSYSWTETVNAGLLRLAGGNSASPCQWHGDSQCMARHLLPNGRAILTQYNGQVCFLDLYHGNRRVTLVEAERLLQTNTKVSSQ